MADHTDFNCCLMGDILIPSNLTCSVSLTVSTPTTYAVSVVLQKGDWFASALHMFQYLVKAWNDSIPGGQMTVTLVTDSASANFGKFAVTPDATLGTVTAFVVGVPSVYASLGLSSASHSLGAGSTVKYTGAVPYVLVPFWPPMSYNSRIDTLQGSVDRAEDGTVYSTAGVSQVGVSLALALDRYQGYSETTTWLSLWLDIWSRGRSVVFYMDADGLPVSSAATLSNGQSLVCENQDGLDFTRLVDYSVAADYTKVVELLLRKPQAGDIYSLPSYELR